jgi:5-methylcytosine-specific restriction endonuclease McrA
VPRTRICAGRERDGTRCANPTQGRTCPLHADSFGALFGPRTEQHRVYASRRWRRLRRQVLDDWVRAHGWTCPGWRRAAHPAARLQVDHVIPLVAGGAPYDPANLRPLCPSCNARKSLHDRYERR